MTDSTCGYIIAAIAPWSTRERSSMIALCAKAAKRRRDHEPRHPDEEQPLSAKDVTKSAAGDQQHRVGEAVAGDHELDVGVVGGKI